MVAAAPKTHQPGRAELHVGSRGEQVAHDAVDGTGAQPHAFARASRWVPWIRASPTKGPFRLPRSVTQTVPANGQATFTAAGVSMTNASDTGCQGATFTIPVTFTAASA